MNYNTDVQRRLSQILDTLNIKTTFYQNEGIFYLKEQGLLILEEDTQLPKRYIGNDRDPQHDSGSVIRIFQDGSLKFIDGSDVTLKYCKTCDKFSFGHKVKHAEDTCPFCNKRPIKYLSSNSKIPGWFGKEEENALIDSGEAARHLQNFFSNKEDAVRECIDKLTGKVSYITISPEKKEKMLELKEKFPNMVEVIEYLIQCFEASNLRKHKEISFRPFVLVGGPGCGKTSFVTDLATILLGHKAVKIDLGNDVPVFAIAGSDPEYNHSKHGLLIESMFKNDEHGPLKNPLIHFDELDKIHSDENYSIETIFYSILEKNTARRFFDNFIGINVDASGVNYIFTANSLEKIPKPIINRLRVFQIPDYTQEQFKDCVIDNFYKNWLINNDMEQDFLPAVLSDEIKEEILQECKNDTRNIEDAIYLVFTKTMRTDDETGHKVALFSAKEYFIGWQNFRGKKNISKKDWLLPVGFRRTVTYPDLIP